MPGFHQSRYGYKNIDELETVMAKYEAINFPVESIWSDIDHMDAYKDFTLHPEHYPEEKLRSFVQGLHDKDQKFIMIIDPGIEKNSHINYIIKASCTIVLKHARFCVDRAVNHVEFFLMKITLSQAYNLHKEVFKK